MGSPGEVQSACSGAPSTRSTLYGSSTCVLAFFGGMPVLGALPWLPEDAWGARVALGALAVLSVVTPGALLEGKSWARTAELGRILFAGILLVVLMRSAEPVVPLALMLVLLSAASGAVLYSLTGSPTPTPTEPAAQRG